MVQSDATKLTHERVLRLAVPIVLSNATIPLLGAADVAIVGQLDAAAPIGAVGLGAIILTSIFWIFGFLRMGTIGLVGQALGAGDEDGASHWLTRGLCVAVIGGLTLFVLQVPIFSLALALAPASDEVETLTWSYLSIRIWGAPAAISVYALTGWLIAQERTLAVFFLQFLVNGLNIGLSYLLGLTFGLGVEGVALATVIADWAGAAFGLILCASAFRRPAWRDWGRIFDSVKLLTMAKLSNDIFLRSAMLMIIFSSFVFLGAGFGDVTLAANEVLIQFTYIIAYALDGFAFAAETLVARAYGRKDPALVRKSAAITSIWGAGISLVLCLTFVLFGGAIIDFMAKSMEVREAARLYLPWMVLAPILGCAAWMLDGIFIGAARGRDMRNMMAISFVGYWLAVLILLPIFGNNGLWAALLLSFVFRGLTLWMRYPALIASAQGPELSRE